jgi:hypothetical protein
MKTEFLKKLMYFIMRKQKHVVLLCNGACECTLLSTQRQILKNSITKVGGRWPIYNNELAKVGELLSIFKHYHRKHTTTPKDCGSRAIIHKRTKNPKHIYV